MESCSIYLLRLPFFTQYNFLEAHPSHCIYQHFVHFYCRVVFHSMDTPLSDPSLTEGRLSSSVFGSYEQSYYNICVSFYVKLNFHILSDTCSISLFKGVTEV